MFCFSYLDIHLIDFSKILQGVVSTLCKGKQLHDKEAFAKKLYFLPFSCIAVIEGLSHFMTMLFKLLPKVLMLMQYIKHS